MSHRATWIEAPYMHNDIKGSPNSDLAVSRDMLRSLVGKQ